MLNSRLGMYIEKKKNMLKGILGKYEVRQVGQYVERTTIKLC